MNIILTFLRDVRKELHKVTWPTRSRTLRYSWLVIAISIATAVFLGILDYLFGGVLKQII